MPLAFDSVSSVYPHGINARQFRYMVANGMTPFQAIQAATVNAAAVIGQSEALGDIAPSHFADLIAVRGNPLENVSVLEDVEEVIKGGEIFH